MKSATPRPTALRVLVLLVEHAAPERGRLALGVALLLVASAASLLYPQGIRLLVDGALRGPTQGLLDRAALLMAGLALVLGAAGAARYRMLGVVAERTVARLRQRLFRHLLDQEVGFFDTRATGELTSRLGTDTQVLQSAVSAHLAVGLRALTHVVGGAVFLVVTSPGLTALMLPIVPLVSLGAVACGRRMRRLSREAQDAQAAAAGVANESLGGIRTVRSFDAEARESARYDRAIEVGLALARRRIQAGAGFVGISAMASYGVSVVVFWYGGHLVARGSMSVGALTSFIVYTGMVAFALGALANVAGELGRAAGSAERVAELLARTPHIPPNGGLVPSEAHGRLQLRNVKFAYPGRADVPALEAFNLDVAAGELVAVVGPSGAGKSTLAQLLARLYDPQAGVVLLDGRDVRALDPRWLRGQIGMVGQEPLLFSTTIAENIRYGRPDATDAEVRAAARVAHADAFIQGFPAQYQTHVGERGVQLSGGQKQRLAIARAILKHPSVLILDEATSALDAESEQWVQQALASVARGRTTLVIAHRLSTVRHADRVVVLDRGRVLESGSHDALFARGGLYRRLVERQLVGAESLSATMFEPAAKSS
jgi:ABC transporter fused permease/ATP-binding protein